MKNRGDVITAIAALVIVFYVLWYILTHSPQFVTYSDLFTLWGGTLSIFGLFVNKLFNKIDKIEEKIDNKIDKLDEKINGLVKELSYFKGTKD